MKYTKLIKIDVPANSTEEFSHTINQPGLIERCELKLPPGPEGDLLIYPLIIRKRNSRENMLGYGMYLSGDDDDYNFSVSMPVKAHDVIIVKGVNNDSVNDHTAELLIHFISYEVD